MENMAPLNTSRLLSATDSRKKQQNAAALTANTCHHILAVFLLDTTKLLRETTIYSEGPFGENTVLALSQYYTE